MLEVLGTGFGGTLLTRRVSPILLLRLRIRIRQGKCAKSLPLKVQL
jgi:hypothetical protein